MSNAPVVALRDLSQPDSAQSEDSQRSAELVSSSPAWVEVDLTDGGAPIASGTPVGIHTSETIYMGHVESGETVGDSQRLRVRVDHWLAVQDVAVVQKLWSQDQPN